MNRTLVSPKEKEEDLRQLYLLSKLVFAPQQQEEFYQFLEEYPNRKNERRASRIEQFLHSPTNLKTLTDFNVNHNLAKNSFKLSR